MIFGFNTDITARETVYHVQTEVCEQQPRLQSQIFVRGTCVDKRSSDLPEVVSDEQIQQLARTQHRLIVEAVRSGSMKLIDPARRGLQIDFLSARRLGPTKTILRFGVAFDGDSSPSARVSAKWKIGEDCGVLDERNTDEAGAVEMRLYPFGVTIELQVTARFEGREVSRSFLVKPTSAGSYHYTGEIAG